MKTCKCILYSPFVVAEFFVMDEAVGRASVRVRLKAMMRFS